MYKKILTNSKGGRRLVISDVHGCLKTLKTLLEKKINLTRNDQLFLLGDYINKGKNSAGVLDYILELREKEYQIYPLRGNHEQKLLDSWQEYNRMEKTSNQTHFALYMIDSLDLLNESGELHSKYTEFLEQLPYYYELDKFYLVHAGFNFKAENPFTDYPSMISIRNFHTNPTSKTIIHGHQIKQFNGIKQKVEAKSNIIPLDNGCYKRLSYRNIIRNIFLRRKIGNLCCLNLDSFELIVQKNVD